MEGFSVYCIGVYRNRMDSSKYMMSPHTISGDDISARIETLVTVEAKSWSNEWELVSFSHTILPYQISYQL